jgi:hypothetical protein
LNHRRKGDFCHGFNDRLSGIALKDTKKLQQVQILWLAIQPLRLWAITQNAIANSAPNIGIMKRKEED